jgi:5'-nucleotidase
MGDYRQSYPQETRKILMSRFRVIGLATVLLAACSANTQEVADQTGLTFIHLNDTYRIGAVESGNAGGLGRVVTIVRQLQQQGRDVRVLHGGDFLYPSLESQLWNGEQMVDAMNFIDDIAPLYVVAGNHEFDRRTPEHLANAVRKSRFDWLGDNYQFDTGASDVDSALRTEFTFEYAGQTIGVFALTLHPDDGGNERDYVPTDGDYIANARRVIAVFEAEGVDLIVGLTHLHLGQDAEIAKLKAEHPKFLFMAGGHEHEPEHEPESSDSAAVVKGASNARIIWQIDVDFSADGTPAISQATPINLTAAIERDVDYEQLASSWRGELLEKFPFLEARIGEAAVPLDGREETIRNQESNWGNFVVDQMRTAFGEGPADLAFINSGTLRIDDFISGEITFEDIGRTFGFSSYLRYLAISGQEFKTMMEAGYRGEGPSKGYFPQVSGFRICIDRSRDEFHRIVSLQVPARDSWQEIVADKMYEIVIPDFLYGGGDGYQVPKDRPASKAGSELKYLVLDAIMAAQGQGLKVGQHVDPANPRIVVLQEPGAECFPQPIR